MKQYVINLLDFIDGRRVVRRLVLFVTLWLTWRSFEWAAFFAETTTRSGIDVAAIIAAVTAPVSTLLAAVVKFYGDNRNAGS